ncbi:MAG: hypothetical protein ABIR47_03170 [Candidatus Kapaibacterium sp.]
MRIKKLLLPLASLMAGCTIMIATASAQYQNVAIGTQSSCNLAGTSTFTGALFNGRVVTIPANGTATFQWIATSQVPASATLTPVSVSGSGIDPVYGPVAFSLDNTRPAPNSTITANQAETSIPATGNLTFNLTVTIGAFPGVVYESIQPLTQNATLFAWPHNNAQYNSLNQVDFQDRAHPGPIAFSMATNTMPATVTAVNQ